MNDAIELEMDAEILTYDVSDETLEASAAAERTGRVAATLMFYTCGSCPSS